LVEQLNFQDDKLNGIVTRWFPISDDATEPQKQLESEFLDGLRNGTSIEWRENGQISNQVEFKNGKRNGRTRRWDTEGNLELDLEFLDGEPVDPGASPSDTADTENAATDTAE
jgi:antitoxin component YwqK of YwqJK toxin-antitoxin module